MDVSLLLPFLSPFCEREFQTTNYGRVAAIWDALEVLSLQPLSKVREFFVTRLPFRPRNPLIAGCGTGKFPLSFIDAQCPCRLTLNDLAPGMIGRAVRRVKGSGWSGELMAVEGDMTELRPSEPYDFVALQFVLTCFPQESRARLIERMRECATPDAIWLICDFSRPRRRILLPFFYAVFFAAVVLFWLLRANPFELPGNMEAAILASGLRVTERYEVGGGLYTAWCCRGAGDARTSV